jgi:hypothetical protein
MSDVRRRVFFCEKAVPSDEEKALAKALGITAFRHARLAERGELEDVGAVAGKVPERYRNLRGVKVLEAPKSPDEEQAKAEQPARPIYKQEQHKGR